MLANFLKMNTNSMTAIETMFGCIVVKTTFKTFSDKEIKANAARKNSLTKTHFNKWREATKEARAGGKDATDLCVDDATLDNALAHVLRAQVTLDEAIRADNITTPDVLDPAVVGAIQELVESCKPGMPDDVREAKHADIVGRIPEDLLPQYMVGLSEVNKNSLDILTKEKENRKRAREESAAGGESYTSPKKQTPLRLTAAQTGGAFAPGAPVHPPRLLAVVNWPQGLAQAPVEEQAGAAADDMSDA